MKIKNKSAVITPKSNTKAARNPFVAAVSRTIKKTGPIMKHSNIPSGTAIKKSWNIVGFKEYIQK